MTIRESEDALFSEWKTKRPRIVSDGCVDEQGYLSSKIKMCFLLQETIEKTGGWDLREFLYTGGRGRRCRTQPNLSRWIYAIISGTNGISVRYEDIPNDSDEFRKSQLRSGCFVNVKKEPNENSSVKKGVVKRYFEEDIEFIRRQISIYQPDLLIICGTWCPFNCEKWFKTENDIYWTIHDKTKIISYCHPAKRRASNKVLCENLLSAVREINIQG